MGTISSSLASTSTASSGASTFTGTSSYSKDFQNVIDRATAIASLPIQLLTNQQTALNAQSGAITKLDTKFTALQSAIQGIQDAMGGAAFQAGVSDPKVLTATVGAGATEGAYSIDVTKIGSYAGSLTAQTWNAAADPSGNLTTYNLVVNGKTYAIVPTDNSAATVASTINAQYGNLVHATALNVGPIDTPDYRISLQSTTLGPMDVSIQVPAQAGLQKQQAPTAGYAISQTGWSWDSTPAASGNTDYTLSIGATQKTFSLADNSATAVADAINGLTGNPVTASVVDLGSGANHDYRIKLQNNATGVVTLDLQRSTDVHLQTQRTPPGELATYEVGGSGTTVSSNTRSITVSDGTTLTLLGTGTVDVTVTRSTSALSTALSTFADAYNAAVIELDGQRGQSGGALQGQTTLSVLAQTLSGISTYNSSGTVTGLTNLGLKLGSDGHFTYDPFALASADIANSVGVTSFLGSSTGGGFLKIATAAMQSLEDSQTGILKNFETDVQSQIAKIGKNISDKTDKVQQMQLHMQNQLAAADALIATMEQQASYMNSMFSAMQTTNQMYSK